MESIIKDRMLSFLTAYSQLMTQRTLEKVTIIIIRATISANLHHFAQLKPNGQYTLVYNNHDNLGKINRPVSTPGVRRSRNLPVFAQVSTVSCADSTSVDI